MANLASENQLYEETFKITGINAEKYDRVSRLSCQSTDGATKMDLDINYELFPCQVGETLHVVLATSLSLDGTKDDEKGWRDVAKAGGDEASLADMYDYVCHGKVYKFEDDESHEDQMNVYTSFGGLLMALFGPYKKLTSLRVDYVYLLVKK
ncbi:DNA-directed RNA polymerases I [Coniochaeta sp. 2T2.1]|nr:DNA-directed RNA polymerases I [Coniochaeta sp. 2T2.1]